MEGSLNKNTAKWWCVHFGEDQLDATSAKRLQMFFKRVTNEVSYGEKRVFLNVTKSEWRTSIHSFQKKLAIAAKKLKLNPESWQWGVGETLAESWVQARWRTLSPDLLPIEAMSDYLNPFEIERKSSDEIRRLRLLRALGMSTLQDLLEMQEDELLSQYGIWIGDISRTRFSKPEILREQWLEKTTESSFTISNKPFQLEDWIPEEYLAVS